MLGETRHRYLPKNKTFFTGRFYVRKKNRKCNSIIKTINLTKITKEAMPKKYQNLRNLLTLIVFGTHEYKYVVYFGWIYWQYSGPVKSNLMGGGAYFYTSTTDKSWLYILNYVHHLVGTKLLFRDNFYTPKKYSFDKNATKWSKRNEKLWWAKRDEDI